MRIVIFPRIYPPVMSGEEPLINRFSLVLASIGHASATAALRKQPPATFEAALLFSCLVAVFHNLLYNQVMVLTALEVK